MLSQICYPTLIKGWRSLSRTQFRRDFDSQGIGMSEMLFRCNILALVGGGSNPRFPATKVPLNPQFMIHDVQDCLSLADDSVRLLQVMIWDDHQGRCIGELGFRSQVRILSWRQFWCWLVLLPYSRKKLDASKKIGCKYSGTGCEIEERQDSCSLGTKGSHLRFCWPEAAA